MTVTMSQKMMKMKCLLIPVWMKILPIACAWICGYTWAGFLEIHVKQWFHSKQIHNLFYWKLLNGLLCRNGTRTVDLCASFHEQCKCGEWYSIKSWCLQSHSLKTSTKAILAKKHKLLLHWFNVVGSCFVNHFTNHLELIFVQTKTSSKKKPL